MGGDVEFGGVLVWLCEVDVGCYETVLHHEERIDDLACACHPTFVAGHAFGGTDQGAIIAKNAVNGLCFETIANGRGCSVGIDVIDIFWLYLAHFHGHGEGAELPIDIGVGNVFAIGTEAVANEFGQNSGATCLGAFEAFEDDGGCTTAWHQSISVPVEWFGCFGGFVFLNREGSDAIETSEGVWIYFLSASADDLFLQSHFDEQVAHSDGMRTAGTGGTYGEVYAFELENGAQIHGDGAVHGLEDVPRTNEHGVFLLAKKVNAFDDGTCCAIVSEENSYFVGIDELLRHACMLQGLLGRCEGIKRLFGHVLAFLAAEFSFQIGHWNVTYQSRTETHFLTDRIKYNS